MGSHTQVSVTYRVQSVPVASSLVSIILECVTLVASNLSPVSIWENFVFNVQSFFHYGINFTLIQHPHLLQLLLQGTLYLTMTTCLGSC